MLRRGSASGKQTQQKRVERAYTIAQIEESTIILMKWEWFLIDKVFIYLNKCLYMQVYLQIA